MLLASLGGWLLSAVGVCALIVVGWVLYLVASSGKSIGDAAEEVAETVSGQLREAVGDETPRKKKTDYGDIFRDADEALAAIGKDRGERETILGLMREAFVEQIVSAELPYVDGESKFQTPVHVKKDSPLIFEDDEK